MAESKGSVGHGHPLCVSRSGRALLSPPGRTTLGPNVYAAGNRKVCLSHPIIKCQTRGEASARQGFQSESSVWVAVVGILAEFGRTACCLQRQPFGLRPGPSLGNFPSTGSAHWATLPWELLGKPGSSRHPGNRGCIILSTPILSVSLKELMDCFSPTPSFSNKRFP